MPPGPVANAEPVVAARRAAERASVRKVRDMVIGSRSADCAPKSVTKVQRNRVGDLLEEYGSPTFSCQNGRDCAFRSSPLFFQIFFGLQRCRAT